MYNFYEFFAGGGMARAGLGDDSWKCLFANDIDEKKAKSYRANWPGDHLHLGDVADLDKHDLPESADLAWASFPCQDLSLAGAGAGLNGDRSGTFHAFWSLIMDLKADQRAPKLVVLENVVGALTADDGKAFTAIGQALAEGGYRFGAVVADAAHWVPQSRPRLFIIAVHESITVQTDLVAGTSRRPWHPAALATAQARLSSEAQAAWIWWQLPEPPTERVTYQKFADLVETDPTSTKWHTQEETKRLLALMNDNNRAKVTRAAIAAKKMNTIKVGTVYKRMRPEGPYLDEAKKLRQKFQRAEVRFDDVAGCLRTPSGGSSRQTILVVEPKRIRSRLLSTREAARLMGLPDSYELPEKYNDAYHLTGDGVVVPVVDFLAVHILEPILKSSVTERYSV